MMCILVFIAGFLAGVALGWILRRRYKCFPDIKLSHSAGFIPTEWEDTESGRLIKRMTLTHISTVRHQEDD